MTAKSKINRLKYNRIQCNHCNDVIMSNYRHDFVTCSCGKVSVDGGLDYLKRCFTDVDDYVELSEWWDDDINEDR